MKTTEIRFASTLPYIGNTRSGSVSGYTTIWAQRIRWSGADGRWICVGNPKPVKINQNNIDLQNYRGKLYDMRELYSEGQLVEVAQ